LRVIAAARTGEPNSARRDYGRARDLCFLLKGSIDYKMLTKTKGAPKKMKSVLLTFFKFLGIEMSCCLRLLCAAILKQ
jgi:hypothetical protein